jgi:hypothetical protein
VELDLNGGRQTAADEGRRQRFRRENRGETWAGLARDYGWHVALGIKSITRTILIFTEGLELFFLS